MVKNLFVSKSTSIKKKKAFLISSELAQRLNELEQRAEKAGFSFPLNKHVEDEISRLVKSAEVQIKAIEASDT
jgi:hypothetical protein